MIIAIIYLVIGYIFLLSIKGYENFPPPNRFVREANGRYRIKDYIPMPHWLWCIVLTIFWLPYTILLLIAIRREL